jgi:MoxR-like ATPase
MALDVMQHRLVLSYEALSDNVSAADLIKKIIARIPKPSVPLDEYARIRTNA